MMKKRILISASLFHALTDASTVVIPTVFPILYNQGFLITRYSQIGLLSNLGLLATLLIQFGVVRLSYRRDYRIFLPGQRTGDLRRPGPDPLRPDVSAPCSCFSSFCAWPPASTIR